MRGKRGKGQRTPCFHTRERKTKILTKTHKIRTLMSRTSSGSRTCSCHLLRRATNVRRSGSALPPVTKEETMPGRKYERRDRGEEQRKEVRDEGVHGLWRQAKARRLVHRGESARGGRNRHERARTRVGPSGAKHGCVWKLKCSVCVTRS